MRENLEARDEERLTFCGTFVRFGTKSGWKGMLPTVLLRDIRTPSGDVLCDHLWFNLTLRFAALDLKPGDVVQFDARVTAYEKGYRGRRDDVDAPLEIDYKLSHPTKVQKLLPAS